MGLFDKLLQGNILYYPGCLSKFILKDIANRYVSILSSLGIKFIQLKDSELCCGSPALNNGYRQDFLKLRDINLETLKKNNISKVITNCPSCYKIFKSEYEIEVEHITQVIWKNIDKFKRKYNEDVSYHDPCNLGRLGGIYSEPRLILGKLGFNVIELKENMENSICCGAGGGLKANSPGIANKVANLTLSEVKTSKLITSCPMCYLHFKENSSGINVMEISECLKV